MAHGAKDSRKVARGNKKTQEAIYLLGIDGYNNQQQQRREYAAAKKKSNNAKKQRYYDDED